MVKRQEILLRVLDWECILNEFRIWNIFVEPIFEYFMSEVFKEKHLILSTDQESFFSNETVLNDVVYDNFLSLL